MVFRYERREYAASLKVQEYEGEKKIDVGENLQPKHCPNQENCTIVVHVCRFEGGPKLRSLKSPINIVWDPDT